MSQIHHYSIAVQDTTHVAEVLCELFGGTITPFGPYENSYIVWFGDEYGSAIELYPAGTEMFPDAGDGQANFHRNASASRFTATHAAISINRRGWSGFFLHLLSGVLSVVVGVRARRAIRTQRSRR